MIYTSTRTNYCSSTSINHSLPANAKFVLQIMNSYWHSTIVKFTIILVFKWELQKL